MRQVNHEFVVQTRGQGLYDLTSRVTDWCGGQGFEAGILTLFIRHTSASLTIQENADPDVLKDLTDFFTQLAPEGDGYRHSSEGPDDMPAHIKAALTATQLSIPLSKGSLALGTWQGIYVFEHRLQAYRRKVAAHLIGD